MEMKTTKDFTTTNNRLAVPSSPVQSYISYGEFTSESTRVNSSYTPLAGSKGTSNTIKYRDSNPKYEEEKKSNINIRIVDRVGQGAYGTVFTALDMNTGSLIALKVIALDLKSEKWRKSLENLGIS